MTRSKQTQLWIVNVVSFVLVFLLTLTGLINWLVLPHGGGQRWALLVETRHFVMDVHAWLSLFFLVAVIFHLSLNWLYVRSNLARMGRIDKK